MQQTYNMYDTCTVLYRPSGGANHPSLPSLSTLFYLFYFPRYYYCYYYHYHYYPGTQFGMLIHFMKTEHRDALQLHGSTGATAAAGDAPSSSSPSSSSSSASPTATATAAAAAAAAAAAGGGGAVGDLVSFYRAAKVAFDDSDVFKAASRAEVVALQSGDPSSLAAWNAICDISRVEFQSVYDKLGVTVTERGESFYNAQLKGVVSGLLSQDLLQKSNGAQCVFVPGFTNG